MTLEEATKRLAGCIEPDGRIYNLGWFISFNPHRGGHATLDGDFSADDLEAIAVYMRANLKGDDDGAVT